jgi:hypothetical protein
MTTTSSQAKVTIRRDHHSDARERQVYARIDDAPNHVLMFGGTVTIEVAPGLHHLRANNTLFWKKVTFSVEPGEHLEFTLINICIWEGMRGLLEFFAGAVPLRLLIKRRCLAGTSASVTAFGQRHSSDQKSGRSRRTQ